MKRIKGTLLACAGILALAGGAGCGEGTTGAGGDPQGGGTVVFTISGESLALAGYNFPPAPGAEVAFVDGWEVEFKRLIVTVDAIRLSETPDLDPGDQAKTGKLVAEVNGPWAVDLHKGGPLLGKGGSGEEAVEIARLDKQNKNGDAPFAGDERYAFGFDVVVAQDGAVMVNLDDEGEADYEEMKQKGYAVLYVGTATFKGDASCAPPPFDAYPQVVDFKLGFASPTTYLNCQNPDNDPASPFDGEEHLRGVAIKGNQEVIAQLTIHTDHPFWDTLVHDAPPHFDMIAARAVGATGTPVVTMDDLASVDPTAITDKNGMPVPFRTCTDDYTPPSMGQMYFETGGIPVSPGGDPATTLRDLRDFMTYNQSTQGHLNADGLCATRRNYPSPP